jgi:UDP-N-acetylmuramate--alanine ligase
LILLPIYAAGEDPIAGLDSGRLLEGIKEKGHREVRFKPSPAQVIQYLKENLRPGDVVVTLGAGDVWKIGQELVSSKGAEKTP